MLIVPAGTLSGTIQFKATTHLANCRFRRSGPSETLASHWSGSDLLQEPLLPKLPTVAGDTDV